MISTSKRNEEGKLAHSAEAYSGRKLVLLHDWWLVKADPDCHGKQLGIGGFALKKNQGIRSFSSAPIVKREDAVTLQTVDNITIMVHGYLNRSRTLENGFSPELCDHFLIGFPYYWEEFSSSSTSEHDHSSDATPTKVSSAKKETSVPIQSMDSAAVRRTRMAEKKRRNRMNVDGGPLTRSRARLLDN